MSWLLDTSAVIAVLRNRPARVRTRLEAALDAGEPVAVCSVVLYELWYGATCSERRADNEERIRLFLGGGVETVAFEADDARMAGELRTALERQGSPIGPYDLLIAGVALRRRDTLVTGNISEFARVPGLGCVDWDAD